MRQEAAQRVPRTGRHQRWSRPHPVAAARQATRYTTTLAVRTVRLYIDDHCGTYAAATAYYAIFSLVPLGLVILSVLGMILSEQRIEEFVFDLVPLQDTSDVRDNVRTIISKGQDVSVAGLGIGLLILLWSSSGIFGAVRRGLNQATPLHDTRPYWRGKLIDIALIPTFGLLILTFIVFSTIAQVIVQEADVVARISPGDNLIARLVTLAVAVGFSFGVFALLYRFVPTERPPWRQALIGAILATVLFELGRNAYAIFVAATPYTRDTAVYASIGTALTFLFWMFMNASILLIGAEFGRAWAERGIPRDRERVRVGDA